MEKKMSDLKLPKTSGGLQILSDTDDNGVFTVKSSSDSVYAKIEILNHLLSDISTAIDDIFSQELTPEQVNLLQSVASSVSTCQSLMSYAANDIEECDELSVIEDIYKNMADYRPEDL